MSADRPGRLRRALSRLSAPTERPGDADPPRGCAEVATTPICDVPQRERATVSGTLRSVVLRPRAGVPALVADLHDGSGTLALVWLGRRAIPGVDPGRALVATGRVCHEEGRSTMFNPRYELRDTGDEGAGAAG